MKNKIVESLNRRIAKAVLIGVAVVGLAMGFESSATAQERFIYKQMTNTAFGTAYFLTGGSNIVTGNGYQIYQGGTNSVTLTNLLASQNVISNSPSTATPFSLDFAQNVPVWWDASAYAGGTGTSNLVLQLDLSPNGSTWIVQAVTATLPLTGTSTNEQLFYFALSNGTNVFSGYSWARWSFAYSTQTNNVTVVKNQLQVYR